jgi:AcrR family transcriptional regulator
MHAPEVAQPVRLGKRERTRAHLIECASQLVAEKGFEQTTLEDVARVACVTRGAIYSSFKSREELFMAVAEVLWQPIKPRLIPGASLARQMEIVGEVVIDALPDRRKKAIGAASYQVFALTRDDMRRQIAARNELVYALMSEELRQNVPADQLPTDLASFVRIAHALVEGIFSVHALTPELLTAETVKASFRLLACAHVPNSP